MFSARYFAIVILFAVLCVASSCNKRHHNVTRGFYYWKTIYRPSVYELNILHQLQVQKMYIRFFDVDWEEHNHQPIPIAPVQLPPTINDSFSIVPVVFITQKTIANLKEQAVAPLAKSISGLVEALCKGSGIHPTEIQIDCDWTAGTKDIYFMLLTELKKQSFFNGKTESCTIRLHQVKYTTSSGIPPADKGLLMCYSMDDIKKPGARNSILDAGEAKNYLKKAGLYPIPLDIALPVFQWCVLFRNQKYEGILHDVSPDMISNSSLFTHKEGNEYSCRSDIVLQGYSLTANDIIRVESASYDALMGIAGFIAQKIMQPNVNILLFSCDSITLSKYSTHELEAVYNAYR